VIVSIVSQRSAWPPGMISAVGKGPTLVFEDEVFEMERLE